MRCMRQQEQQQECDISLYLSQVVSQHGPVWRSTDGWKHACETWGGNCDDDNDNDNDELYTLSMMLIHNENVLKKIVKIC